MGCKKRLEDWYGKLNFRGVIIEEPDYHIWGTSPIWGNDGKVHVFSSRIPVSTGFDRWWATSQIAHYAADCPEGPFALTEVLLAPGRTSAEEWDCGTQHNPAVTQVDGLYILTYHSNMSTPEHWARSSHSIGMLTAEDINGPWTKRGKILSAPSRDHVPMLPATYNGPTDNPALVKSPDGRFFLYYRVKFPGLPGKNTYCLATADEWAGPYTPHPHRVINNPTYVEDPYVFVLEETFYMVITDNAVAGGLLLKSNDGFSFDYNRGERFFGPLAEYVGPECLEAAAHYRAPQFERPQLLLDERGVPTHMYAPSGSNVNGGPGTCCYLFGVD
jgi:hypothetical protein